MVMVTSLFTLSYEVAMMRKTMFYLSIVVSVLGAQSAHGQETAVPDSGDCGCCVKVDNLNLRIDSLEARLENMQIQLVETNPFKSGKYLRWGKGPMIAIAKSEQRISFDAGYTFLTPNAFRMGMALGFDGELGVECELPHYGFYGKMTYGTPVFVNFISLNTNARVLFYPDGALSNNRQTTGAIGAGAELEFWLTPACCYTIGGSMTIMRKRYVNEKLIDMITQGEINFIGFKYYPQYSRKKR
jgi:hypothetical protein